MLQRLGPSLYRTHIFLSLGVKHAITSVDLFNVKKTEFMQILFGTNLIEPISITYLNIKGGDKKNLAGIIKLHLLHPEIYGVALLKGLSIFILQ